MIGKLRSVSTMSNMDGVWRGKVTTGWRKTMRAMVDWVKSTLVMLMVCRRGSWEAGCEMSPASKEVRAAFVLRLVPGPDNRKSNAVQRRCPP